MPDIDPRTFFPTADARRALLTLLKAQTIVQVESRQLSRDVAAARLRELLSLEEEKADITDQPGLGPDVFSICYQMAARGKLLDIVEAMYELREALLGFAETTASHPYRVSDMTGSLRSGTLGHWALGCDGALARDAERTVSLYARMNKSPAGLGSGATEASGRIRLSTLLGFDGIIENSLDAVFGLDLYLEQASLHLSLTTTLARLCQDAGQLFRLRDHLPPPAATASQCIALKADAMAVLSRIVLGHGGPTGAPALPRATAEGDLAETCKNICDMMRDLAGQFARLDRDRDHVTGAGAADPEEHRKLLAALELLKGQGSPGQQAQANSLTSCRSRLRLGRSRLEGRRAALEGAALTLDDEILKFLAGRVSPEALLVR